MTGVPDKSTKEQPPGKPRACLPDAVSSEAFILIKSCDKLRLTYEIRLATFMARESRRRLRLMVETSTIITVELRAFVAQHGVSIEQIKK